jgi:hypothetical protein
MFQPLKGRESGQSIVIIALAMVAIIGMVALVLDGGYAYLERRRVQNAADSAALAGARALGKGATRATVGAAISEYALRNGIKSPGTNIKAYFVNADSAVIDTAYPVLGTSVVSTDARGVRVQAGEQHATFFARVIGFPNLNVSAVAQAGLESAGAAFGAVPAVIVSATYAVGELYAIWDSDPSVDPDGAHVISSGSRGWAKFPASGAYDGTPSMANWLFNNGYPGTLSIGQWVEDKSGNSLGNTIGDDAGEWTAEHPTWIVPIYDKYDGKEYRIAAFAAFEVDHVVKSGNDSHITGRFKKLILEGYQGGGAQGFGVATLRLQPALP